MEAIIRVKGASAPFMYHVTARKNVPAILRDGLRRDVGPHGEYNCGFTASHVWMFDDPAVAEAVAKTGSWGGSRGDNAILIVNMIGLDTIPDPHPGLPGPTAKLHSRAYPGDIPADRVGLYD